MVGSLFAQLDSNNVTLDISGATKTYTFRIKVGIVNAKQDWHYLGSNANTMNSVGIMDESITKLLLGGYFEHIKEELPSSTISKWEVGDKLVIKVTNFIEDEDDPITNGEDYYIVMEPNTPEQQEEE